MVEVNRRFVEANTIADVGGLGVAIITPPLDAEYFVARVPLFKDQAIQVFLKFGILGCGFAQEEDWNTNLPLRLPAEQIYEHIKKNRKYPEITQEQCLEAIRELQAWWKEVEGLDRKARRES